ncbi:hypothetical protein [Cardinium endosymbiont of Nabis limbatus]|uniref:hypothetical protein n=1 Tax=Cardinium endosymbiont of Nabis limbatus TaxID=3066217 RepID=UPI003AF36132
MQNISLQKSILYTILHCILFCAIAADCDCSKRPVDKSTNINIATPPPPTSPETKNNEPIKGKEGKKDNEGDEDDEEIKKKIEEKLLADKESVEEEISLLKSQRKEEEEEERKEEEEEENLQDNVEPSAPEYEYEPPPPYTDHGFDRNPVASFTDTRRTTTASNVCKNCQKGNNRSFDEEEMQDIISKYRPTKLKIKEYKLKIINKFLRNKKPLYIYKDKLEKYENRKKALEKEQETICTNPALCSTHKAKQIRLNLIAMNEINLKINYVQGILAEIRKKKNNKANSSTNATTSPYPIQQYPPVANPMSNNINFMTPPPSYSDSPKLYPDLSKEGVK